VTVRGQTNVQDTERTSTKTLAICNVDAMAWQFLRPWLAALRGRGHEVHICCTPGRYFDQLAEEGFHMHPVTIHRGLNVARNLKPLVQLYRLVRRGRFDIVNTHSPVASGVGRLAARLAGARNIIYTVHGFYFHDNMRPLAWKLAVAVEWLLGRITDRFLFVSDEDRRTALATGIASSAAQTRTIRNGVDLGRFRPRRPGEETALRDKLGIPRHHRVVGTVTRLVKEKGYRELLAAARVLLREHHDVTFLVVGGNLRSDRDQFGPALKRMAREAGIADRFLFAGSTTDVPGHLRAMDIFVLASYREGFPVSVLEAMGSGLPVVATDIRGCREAVAHGETGLLVPPADARALAAALGLLLASPELTARMGIEGRRRAEQLFDINHASERFAAACLETVAGTGTRMETSAYAGS